MKKQIKSLLALLMVAVMTFGLTACLDDWDTEYNDGEYDGDTADGFLQTGGNAHVSNAQVMGLKITVDEKTGALTVERPAFEMQGKKGPEQVWTILVYLCGADLESDGGMGTDDLEEMLAVQNTDNVRFLVQTGGASYWYNDAIDDDAMQRFLVQNGNLQKVDEGTAASMGKPSTLADFLIYGVEQYPSEHMGVILWDHGGGSINGVCFDELQDNDSLDLAELDVAFYECAERTGRRFDFVGFDACLMGTVETANILASYADYMIGSQETEPGSGWDYTAIGEYLAQNPGVGGGFVGKTICDSFLEACEALDDDDLTTLSVIKLSEMDDLLRAINEVASELYEVGQDADKRAFIIRKIEETENFGGNNRSEGYTNMVDLGGILDACGYYVDSAKEARIALSEAVNYRVHGSAHRTASGLSMYYPLRIQGSQELAMFRKICISPYYLSFVDNKSHAAVSGDADYQYEDYDAGQWFDEAGEWFWGDWNASDDDYWNYLDGYEPTGESPYITFEQEPTIDEEGNYYFVLDDNGYCNAASVSALVYEMTEDGETAIELGETIDVNEDWDYGIFADHFDGYWLCLPDGQNLATYVAEIADDYVVYTSPILLNGRETNLRMKQFFDSGIVQVEGAWDGIDEESGAAARDIIKIKNGDRITPTYYAFSVEGDDEFEYEGAEYQVTGELDVYYNLLEEAIYLYCFCIDDIYGDYYLTDMILFGVDENGEVSFYE